MASAQSVLRTALSGAAPPAQLREEIRNDPGRDTRLRRNAAAVSLVGVASMAIASLYQMGKTRHLPDPPTSTLHFDSDKVNATTEAFGHGMPDGPLTLLAQATSLAVAAAGPADRAPHACVVADRGGARRGAPSRRRSQVPVPPDAKSRRGLMSVLRGRCADALRDIRAGGA